MKANDIVEVVSGDLTKADREHVLKYLDQYLSVFRHHWDMYMKAHALFLTSVGAIGGYVYRPEATQGQRTILTALVALVGAGAVVGSWASYRWVQEFAAAVHSLESRLGDTRFPFSGTFRVIILFG